MAAIHPLPSPFLVVCVRVPEFAAWSHVRGASTQGVIVIRGGKVVSATRRARRKGVRDGMGAATAGGLAPTARVVARDASLEGVAWEAVLSALNRFSPFIEAAEPGLAYVGGVEAEVLRPLAARLGLALGAGTSRSVARVAAARAAEGSTVVVAAGREQRFWSATGVEVVTRLGWESVVPERLSLLGYETLWRVHGLTKRHLEAQFGEPGERLYALLHPRPEGPVGAYQPPPVLRARTYLDDALREPYELLPVIDVLVSEVVSRLNGVHCRRISVRAEADGAWATRARILPISTDGEAYVRRTARRLMLDVLEEGGGECEITGVAVEVGGLSPAAVDQGVLFGARPPAWLAACGVHRRFPGAIRRAVVVDGAVFDEDRVRWEPFPDSVPLPQRRAS